MNGSRKTLNSLKSSVDASKSMSAIKFNVNQIPKKQLHIQGLASNGFQSNNSKKKVGKSAKASPDVRGSFTKFNNNEAISNQILFEQLQK